MPLKALASQLSVSLKPVYVILGQDGLVVEKAEAMVREAALQPGMEVFNLAVFRGEDDRVDEALSIVRTMPMMAQRRVVVVRAVEGIAQARLEEFCDYAKSPLDSCVLVITGQKWPASKGGTDFGRRLENQVKKIGSVIRFKSKDLSPVDFLIEESSAAGFSLNSGDASFLVSRVGEDLGLLRLELDKAMNWLGEPGKLTRAAFEEACSLLSEAEVWDMVDAIVTKNRDKALATTHRLLEEGSEPHQLVGLVAWRMRKLIELQGVMRRGGDPWKAKLGMRGPSMRAAQEAIRKNPLNTSLVLEKLAAANERMNSSRAGDRRVFEGLILSLVSVNA
ncbi:MAG: DNA polymerase III subunit delta [Myxococcota bacterium]|nr:DNA polymerase III subunit delta [Myxococcota bacterium]